MERPRTRTILKVAIRSGLLATLGALSCSSNAAPDAPADVVREFYRNINIRNCQRALDLSHGYSLTRCENIALARVRREMQVSVVDDHHVLVYATVSFRREREEAVSTCDMELSVVKKNLAWIVDFRNSRALHQCNSSTMDKHNEDEQAGTVGHDDNRSQTRRTPDNEAGVSKRASSERGLMQLWTEQQLLGDPGDERIVHLKPPDERSPSFQSVDGSPPILLSSMRGSIRRVSPHNGRKVVALTFDLCEQADDRTGYDRKIVNYLRQKDIHATFFAGGKWMRSHEDKTMQLLADPLFEIGNHTWTHGNLRVMHGQDMLNQITWTQAEFQHIRGLLASVAGRRGLSSELARIPEQPRVFRFPYGTCDIESLRAVNDMGLVAIQWDVVSGDPAPKSTAKSLVSSVLGKVKTGSVVIFHANGRGHGTAEALPIIVEKLQSEGFEFVTVSELLRTGEPDIRTECFENRPGDNKYIDAMFGKGTE